MSLDPNQSPLPIEPGCLCLIIGPNRRPDLIGRQCTAVEPIRPGTEIHVLNRGLVEVTKLIWAIDVPGQPTLMLIDAHNLRRIDGHQPELDELTTALPALTRRTTNA